MSMSAPEAARSVDVPDGHGWALWLQSRRVVAYCLVTELGVIAVAAQLAMAVRITATDLALCAALAGLGVLQSELGRRVERFRRRSSGVTHINMTSVWTAAGVLLLPAVLTAVLVAVLYMHLAARSWHRLQRVPAWRSVHNATSVIITCWAAHAAAAICGIDVVDDALVKGLPGGAAIATVLFVYFAVGALVVIPARNTIVYTWRGLFGDLADNALEATTLCLAALSALTLAKLPVMTVLIVPPVLQMHRTVLLKQLNLDAKTGVLNAAGWVQLAERELARSRQRTCAVYMVDLDFFKQVNDTHGHLAGDKVLEAVAVAITGETREHDQVGRFGGEEFVVLLTDVTERDAVVVAERIRRAITELEVAMPAGADTVTVRGLSASIGVAMAPASGHGVQPVLDAADTALYEAKRGGRNKVVTATQLPRLPTATTAT